MRTGVGCIHHKGDKMFESIKHHWRPLWLVTFLCGSLGFLGGYVTISYLYTTVPYFTTDYYTLEFQNERFLIDISLLILSLVAILLLFFFNTYSLKKFRWASEHKLIVLICSGFVEGLLFSLTVKSILDLIIGFVLTRPSPFAESFLMHLEMI